jgi:hypothetical protein
MLGSGSFFKAIETRHHQRYLPSVTDGCRRPLVQAALPPAARNACARSNAATKQLGDRERLEMDDPTVETVLEDCTRGRERGPCPLGGGDWARAWGVHGSATTPGLSRACGPVCVGAAQPAGAAGAPSPPPTAVVGCRRELVLPPARGSARHGAANASVTHAHTECPTWCRHMRSSVSTNDNMRLTLPTHVYSRGVSSVGFGASHELTLLRRGGGIGVAGDDCRHSCRHDGQGLHQVTSFLQHGLKGQPRDVGGSGACKTCEKEAS